MCGAGPVTLRECGVSVTVDEAKTDGIGLGVISTVLVCWAIVCAVMAVTDGSMKVLCTVWNVITILPVLAYFGHRWMLSHPPEYHHINDISHIHHRIGKLCRNYPSSLHRDIHTQATNIMQRSEQLHQHVQEMKKVLAYSGDCSHSLEATIDGHADTLRKNLSALVKLHQALAENIHMGNNLAIRDAQKEAEITLAAMKEIQSC